eukprot:4730928-Amphidinium_carterae.1
MQQDDQNQARAMAYHDYEPHFEPIHDAVWFGKVQAVQDLLAWQACHLKQDVLGGRELWQSKGDPICCAEAILHASTVNPAKVWWLEREACDNDKAQRPLHLAAKLGHTSIASVLLAGSADVYCRTSAPEATAQRCYVKSQCAQVITHATTRMK